MTAKHVLTHRTGFLGHRGNNGDFKCQFEVYKDLKAGYVIFTNSNTSDALIGAMRQFLFIQA